MISTSPATLIDSASEGTSSSKRELQIRPMKLLDWATRTASLTLIAVRPALRIVVLGDVADVDGVVVLGVDVDDGSSTPRSLQRRTGSGWTKDQQLVNIVWDRRPGMFRSDLQLGCFQFKAVQMSGLYEEKTIDLTKPSLVARCCLA